MILLATRQSNLLTNLHTIFMKIKPSFVHWYIHHSCNFVLNFHFFFAQTANIEKMAEVFWRVICFSVSPLLFTRKLLKMIFIRTHIFFSDILIHNNKNKLIFINLIWSHPLFTSHFKRRRMIHKVWHGVTVRGGELA